VVRSEAFVAAARFGLGPKPGDAKAYAADPRSWVQDQLRAPVKLEPALSGLPSGAEAVRALLAFEKNKDMAAAQEMRRRSRRAYLSEVGARHRVAVSGETPVRERLVRFWSNHFTVSVQRPKVLALAGAFEREAIRPHATGRFADLLHASTRHPAMLVYLDNARSIGPNSPQGRRRERGLNENLAREILELHTLGVDGGYGQDDVTSLAKIITGWSIASRENESGEFAFVRAMHEPGEKTLLGKRYAEAGEGEGRAALDDLARHPSTARHIARKLARHYIADEPPQDAVDRIARVFRDTDGDIKSVMAQVAAEEGAWRPLAKVRSPEDLLVAASRVLALADWPEERLVESLRELGQAPFGAPSPAGWPDAAADWVAPEATLRRVEWCDQLTKRLPRQVDPNALAAESIGGVARFESLQAIERAADWRQGVALLLASPEFQRR
jgi:uncharacterized protein (DUF1800 family)